MYIRTNVIQLMLQLNKTFCFWFWLCVKLINRKLYVQID